MFQTEMDSTKSRLYNLISEAEQELSSLDARRARLTQQISTMKSGLLAEEGELTGVEAPVTPTSVTLLSPPDEKIALFRSLFRGREGVYPQRFESSKTGKSGYQPACQNEWFPGICKKPKVQCRDCGRT